MKKKYLALLLSFVVAFSSFPAVTLNASPVTMENSPLAEDLPNAVDSTQTEDLPNTADSTQTEETTETGETLTDVDKTVFNEESTEDIEDSSEESGGDIEITSEEITSEYDFIEETSIEETITPETSVEEEILLLEDSITVQELFSGNVSIAAYNTENTASLQSGIYAEEDVSGVPYVELDTLIQNENAFRSQLSSDFERQLYDAGKESIVKNGYNYIKLSGISKLYDSWDEICNVFSALTAAYPNKFNWVNWADVTLGRRVYYYKQSNTYTYKYTLSKSKHYTSTLEKNADAKVKNLVAQANAYAYENYGESPAYGIIKYFDNWLCENNFFEKEHGTSTEESVQKGKIFYYSHTCYGPLLKGYGTSEGYALAMSRLLDAAGIRNVYVTGSYNGEEPYTEYAWNYVEMPDGYWYLIDTLRNDYCEDWCEDYGLDGHGHLLIQPDDIYEADSRKGKYFGDDEIGTKLDYDALITPAFEDYFSDTSEAEQLDTLSLNKETVVLKPEQQYQLSLIDKNTDSTEYYGKFIKKWSSDNPQVAKVNKNGKITAGTIPGTATITLETANRTFSCTVYVYKFTNIKFDSNNKANYSVSYANPDTAFNEDDLQTVTLTVNQKNPLITAQDIVSGNHLNKVKAVSDKPRIAMVENVSLEEDTITLDVLPKSVGTAKITITLAGKKAYYTIKVTQDLQEKWFNFSNVKDTTYTGKAIKPSIPLTESGRDRSPAATYTITYTNCKNAGTDDKPLATITITGTGKYSGTLTQAFTISPKDLSEGAEFKSCSPSKTYNAKARAATTTVKLGKTILQAGKDYTVLYESTDTVSANTVPTDTVPTDAGTYKVTIVGKGNYTGTILDTKTYVIKPNSIKNMTVSFKSTVKYTGEAVNPLKNVKISGNVLPPENYRVTYLDNTGAEITAPTQKGKYKLVITPVEGKNITTTLTKTCIKKTFTVK